MNSVTGTRFDLESAQIAVERATLLVHDVPRLAAFYTEVIGLRRHHAAAGAITLGASRPLLTLRTRPGLTPGDAGSPGLYHIAFRVPDRSDLGAWWAAARSSVPIVGAADHNVSEAIYLSDPEGNGIEIYADRPVEAWHDAAGRLVMPTARLDLRGLPAEGDWTGAPGATRIGHVHLQVPDLAAAERFWTGRGFAITARYPGASFLGAGGYHHQLAANVWASAGRPPRQPDQAGLAALTLSAPVADRESVAAPSGVVVTFAPKGA